MGENIYFITLEEHEHFAKELRDLKQRLMETFPEFETDSGAKNSDEFHAIENIMNLKDNLSHIAKKTFFLKAEKEGIDLNNLYSGDNPPRT